MVDGKVMATKSGQSYYGSGSSVFTAYVPVWRRDADGKLFRTSVPLDDRWLRTVPGGETALFELRSMVYTTDPVEVQRRIVEALVSATRARASSRQTVPGREDPFAIAEGAAQSVERNLAIIDLYRDDVFLDPDDLDPNSVRMSVFAPGYNNRARSFIEEVKWRPLRGEVLPDDDLYRKTGLHAEAFRETGRCVLYQLQKVVTTRNKGLADNEQRPRFTLDQLETLFDECWEEELELGPRTQLVEAFLPFADKVAELREPGELERCLRENNSRGLRDVTQRYYGWLGSRWNEKAQRIRRVLNDQPRQCDDWRQHGVTALQLEAVCTKTMNLL
jgi:hypothetical protein